MKDRIVDIARSFVGMQEIQGNMGFQDARFATLMEDTGWQNGQAWCAYFCELVWKIAYNECDATVLRLDKLFDAGAIKTYNNFKDTEFVVDKHPEPGAIVIWQHWKDNEPTWMGHAGIVVAVTNDSHYITIEGNTNAHGGRDGIEVAEKLNIGIRKGLVLKGFIHAI